jgi:hypothetical protein
VRKRHFQIWFLVSLNIGELRNVRTDEITQRLHRRRFTVQISACDKWRFFSQACTWTECPSFFEISQLAVCQQRLRFLTSSGAISGGESHATQLKNKL